MRLITVIRKSLFALGTCLMLQLLLSGEITIQAEPNEGPPAVMSYEGYIMGSGGKPLPSGKYDFTFALYTSRTGGSPIWMEEHKNVTVTNGLIQLYMGKGTPANPLDLPFDQQYFLGVSVGNEREMSPRLELATTPYSFRAKIADKVPDGSITSEKLALLSVTDENIRSVSWSKITGAPESQKSGGGPAAGVPSNVWSLFGNRKTDSTKDFLGTTDLQALVFKTNSLERLRIRDTGEIDIKLDLNVGNDVTIGHDLDVGNDASIDHNLHVGNDLDVFGLTHLHNGTESTSTSTGALVVDGGVGIAKRLNVGGDGLFESKLTVSGATLLQSSLDVVGITHLLNTNESTSTSTGALVVDGGVGIGMRLNVGGDGLFDSKLTVSGATLLQSNLDVVGITHLLNTNESTSTSTGALVVDGGTGIKKNLSVGASVGIGTPAPSNALLHVKGVGTYAGNHIALFENTGSSSPDGIAIKVSAGTPDNNNNFVTFLDSSGSTRGRIEGETETDLETSPEYIFFTALEAFQLAVVTADQVAALASANACGGAGAVACPPIASLIAGAAIKITLQAAQTVANQAFLRGNLGVAYASGSGDYAEYLERLDGEEKIEAGDIVGVFGGKITKSTRDAHQIMVVSLSPIVLGNMPSEGKEHLYEKVAFMGQVAVKIRGAVKEGDYIIPSGLEDGTGIAVPPEMMTADEFPKVVGKAWSSSDSELPKLVNVAVGLNAGDVATLVKKQQAQISNIKAKLELRNGEIQQAQVKLDTLKLEVAELRNLDQKVEQLEMALTKLGGKELAVRTEAAQNGALSDSE